MQTSRAFSVLLPLALIFAASSTVSVAAGTPPPTAGQVQQSLPPAPKPIPQTAPQPVVPTAPIAPAAAPGGPSFRVDTISFSGNTVIGADALQAQVADLKGRTLTFADLVTAAQKLTRFYQSKGYPLATVSVPAQKVEGGAVRFVVVEGTLGAVRVEGNSMYQTEAILYYLSGLQPGQPVSGKALESALLLLNDMPGLDARAVVVPGSAPGTSDLVIKVTEQRFGMRVTGDNEGRDSVGSQRVTVEMRLNSLSSWGDELVGSYIHSEGDFLNYRRLAYSMPVDSSGARLGLSYYETDYDIADPAFALLGLGGDNSALRFGYTRPVVRSRMKSSIFSVGVERLESETSTSGVSVASSAYTVVGLGLFSSGVNADSSSWSSAYTFRTNLQDNNDGLQTDAVLGRFQADLTMNSPLANGLRFDGRMSAVYSLDAAVDMEKFSLGGPYSVRAYQPSEVRGDSGFDASAELQKWFGTGEVRAALIGFVDIGYVSNHAGPGVTQTDGPWLSGVGTGLKIGGKHVYGQFVYAVPMGHYDSVDGERDRFWMSLTGSF